MRWVASFVVAFHLSILVMGFSTELRAEAGLYSEDDFVRDALAASFLVSAASEELKAAKLDEKRADLLTAAQLNSSVSVFDDRRPSVMATPSYESTRGASFTTSVSQQASTGTQFKATLEATHTLVNNLSPAPGAPTQDLQFGKLYPSIEVAQPLWQNSLGRSFDLQREALSASARLQQVQVQAQERMLEFDARMAYARLVLARDMRLNAIASLRTAEKILSYVQTKRQSNLYEQTDLLQTQALVASRQLELRSAETEEASAAVAFNALRGRNNAQVAERLPSLRQQTPSEVAPHLTKVDNRIELNVLREQLAASSTAVQLEVEKIKPTLDAFVSYGMTSMQEDLGAAAGKIVSPYQPNTVIGLRLSMTLDRELVGAQVEAANVRKAALQMREDDSRRSLERDLASLLVKRTHAINVLSIAKKLESIQKDKLANEQTEFRNGRSTTYQLLMFTQDLSNAEVSRLQAIYQIILIDTQLRLFQEKRA